MFPTRRRLLELFTQLSEIRSEDLLSMSEILNERIQAELAGKRGLKRQLRKDPRVLEALKSLGRRSRVAAQNIRSALQMEAQDEEGDVAA